MVRWAPPLPREGEHSFGHDAVSVSLFVACVAATVVLVSSICSACGRKPKVVGQDPDDDKSAAADSVSDAGGHADVQDDGGGTEEKVEVVTLSPELATHGPIEAVALPASALKRRLSISLSKNLSHIPDKLRLSRRGDMVDSPDDTLWKKTVILGDKCKIPGEREEGDAAAGNFRRSSYSRPNSFAVRQPADTPASQTSQASPR